MLLPQIILYTPTFSLQSFTKNNMPSWLHLCFIHWVSVGDVHCRIVKTITIKCRTVWLSRVQLITYWQPQSASFTLVFFTGDKVICDWECSCTVSNNCSLIGSCMQFSLIAENCNIQYWTWLTANPFNNFGFKSFSPSSGVHKPSAICLFVKNKLSSFRASLQLLFVPCFLGTNFHLSSFNEFFFSPTAPLGSLRKQPSIGWVGKSLCNQAHSYNTMPSLA